MTILLEGLYSARLRAVNRSGRLPPLSPERHPMRGGMIDMESNTTLVQCYPAHEAIPDGEGPFPAVVVAHDRFGLTRETRAVANRLAHSGFYALAPSFYAMPSSVADAAPEYLRPTAAAHFE